MNNPDKRGFYSTVFKDGSIEINNYWDNEKWYYNEKWHGGIIHWFIPEEPYEEHSYYLVPDYILIELVKKDIITKAIQNYDKKSKDDYAKMINAYIIEHGCNSIESLAQTQIIYSDKWYRYKIKESE